MNDITLTYKGIFKNPDRDELNKLDLLMRKYQSAKRFSRERIFDGLSREETTKKTRELFLPNLRYMRDAFVEAEANISSQKELLPTCVVQHKQNITNLKERINKTNKSKKTPSICAVGLTNTKKKSIITNIILITEQSLKQ